jgi:hypothetical protein
MAELSVMDYFFVSYKPSEVAIAALLNATERLSPGSTQYMLFTAQTSMLDYDSSNVRACRDRLALIYAQANDQAPIDTSETTPRKGVTEELNRTTSPVSVNSFYQH